MSASYRIKGVVVQGDDPRFPTILAGAHAAKERPLCLCRVPAPAMYIAHIGDKFVLKRMPSTGSLHDADCESYEPPAALSGLGEVVGTAIKEDVESGTTVLKLDFSLSRVAGRSAPVASGAEQATVRTDGTKLTLRGTLHYLWEQAGFNKWSPGMEGKRNWAVIRRYLLQAAADKSTKGSALSSMLYVPESFSLDRKDEIAQRRAGQFSKIISSGKGARKLLILIGEVKEIVPSRYGHKAVIRHVPDVAFSMNEDLHDRMNKRFESELALWDADDRAHLIVIGTFSVQATGIPMLEELALMTVTENWIPFENTFDKALLEALTAGKRRFSKGLRYNLPSSRPLACAVTSDTTPKPVALYVVPPNASDAYRASTVELISESAELAPWAWKAGDEVMPALPLREGYVAAPIDLKAIALAEGEQDADASKETEEE
jgi:hypothetical protein